MSDVIQERNAAASHNARTTRTSVSDAQSAGWRMFHAAGQLETMHWLVHALGAREPLVAVIGDIGMGKSVVAAVAAAQLEARGTLVIATSGPFAGPLELQAVLAQGLGLPRAAQTTPAAVAAAIQGRGSVAQPAKPVVLMIDAAETLTPLVLQYLWLMHRLCGSGVRALQMVFVGRLAFWDHLAIPELAGLQSATAVRTVLPPLADDEALAYMQYRLEQFGVAKPAAVPRKLAREILVLGQGVPSRINVIADAIVAQEPKRLRVTPKVVRAAEAMLAGGSAPTREPARRRFRGFVLVAGVIVAAAALFAGWLLSADKPRALIRTAAAPAVSSVVAPMPRRPTPPHTPTPTPTQAAVRAPTIPVEPPSAKLPQPVPPALPAVAAAPAAASAPPEVATKPATVAPPVVVLPEAAMPHIIVQYPAADPAVAAHATSVVAILRARGLSVGDPVPIAGPGRPTGVEYYFDEDKAEATQLARELGGSVSVGRIDGRNPDAPPPPGTLRVLLSNRGASGNVFIPTSAPTPKGADAPPSTSQEPP